MVVVVYGRITVGVQPLAGGDVVMRSGRKKVCETMLCAGVRPAWSWSSLWSAPVSNEDMLGRTTLGGRERAGGFAVFISCCGGNDGYCCRWKMKFLLFTIFVFFFCYLDFFPF